MKKIYSFAAIAALAVPAIAATPMQKASLSSDAQLAQVQNIDKMESATNRVKGPAKKVSNLADICGIYKMTYTWALSNADPWDGVLCVNFTPGMMENEIIITNMPYSDIPITATVDYANQTLTFSPQDAGVINGEMCTWGMKGDNGGEYLEWVDSITAEIGEDGNIEFTMNDMILMGIMDEGYYLGFRGMTYEKIPMNIVDLAEYHPIGNAEFTDDCLNHLFKEEYRIETPVQVPAYANADNTVIVLDNPYMRGAWAELNMQSDPSMPQGGFFEINIEVPECALLDIMTDSGFVMDWAEQNEPEDYMGTCLYNTEAKKVQFEEYEVIDVIDEFDAAEAELSNFDEETNTIFLCNVWFAPVNAPLLGYGFKENGEWYNCSLLITLPENWNNDDAVETVAAANGQKRFFNLQGMEVQAPEAGEVVIVKEGSKVSKVIF